jgi:hypothetical protein
MLEQYNLAELLTEHTAHTVHTVHTASKLACLGALMTSCNMSCQLQLFKEEPEI